MRAPGGTAGPPPGAPSYAVRRSQRRPRSPCRSLGRGHMRDVAVVILVRFGVGIGVMERVEREVAGDREAKAAVVEMVDDLDRDFVGAGIPEEGDLEAVLVAVGEFFRGYVRHRASFLVAGLGLDSPSMRLRRCRSRPGRPHSYP